MNRRDAIASFVAAFALAPSRRTMAASRPAAGPFWITLGTSGGPQVQAGRAQISNALVVNQSLYLFDLGNDVQRQLARAGISESRLRAVFLSHHHLDHNADLGPIMLTHWLHGTGSLRIIGPAGTARLANGIAAANDATVLASFPTAGPARPPIQETCSLLELAERLTEPTEIHRDENIVVSAISVDHYQVAPSIPLPEKPQALAFRIEAGGRSFVYSGDTGPSAALARLARDADFLITEVVDLEGIANRIALTLPNVPQQVRNAVVAGMRVNHLTPEEIGRMASAANVGTVVLTHFVPNPEQLRHPGELVRAIKRHFGGKVIMANDLDRFG